MSYYLISDFRQGVDTRRIAEASVTGTLRWLSGGFVNSGGEVEKLRGIIKSPGLTAALQEADGRGGWCGPVRTANGGFAFAGPATQPPLFPASVGGVPLYWSHMNGAPQSLVGLSSNDLFGNKIYLAAQFDAFSTVQHWAGVPGNPLTRVGTVDDPHVRTLASKVFRGQNEVLAFSAVGDPADLSGTGSGDLNVTTAEGAVGPIQGLGLYFNRLAVFGTAGVQIWTMDPDPNLTQYEQTIGGISLNSGRTILTYDNGDLLFLTPHGIRSLRARDQTAFATGDDIGSPLDDLVRATLRSGSPSGPVGPEANALSSSLTAPRPEEMVSTTEPSTGQLWMIVGSTAFIFSRFSSQSVRAWSFAELPNSSLGGGAGYVRGATVAGNRLLICTADGSAFIYGGESGQEYDTSRCVVETPFMGMDSPATYKSFHALDILAKGEWTVEMALDPNQPDLFERVGTLHGTTTRLQQIPITGRSTHVAFRFTSTENQTIAKLGQAAVHFKQGKAG